MKTYFDCIPCFIRQALDAARTLKLGDETTSVLLRRILGLVQRLDWSLPPPVIGRDIHRAIREILNDADPYLHRKTSDTEAALELLPEVEAQIADSDEPFLTAIKFSIAGNAIDLGAKTGVEADVEKTFRGAPAINDATMDDAKRSGIVGRFRVISNGSDTPGTWLSECSREFVQYFDDADLVISKGQGNYESLSDQNREIYFLFLIKCPLVAEELDLPVHTYVTYRSAKEETSDEIRIGDAQ